MKRARSLWVGTVVLNLALNGCAREPDIEPSSSSQSTSTKELVASRGTLEQRVLLTGELDAVRAVAMIVPTTDLWQLTISWLVEDGDRVKKGDRLLEFDNSAFASQLESQRLLYKQTQRDYDTGRHLRALTVADAEHKLAVATLKRDKAALRASVAKDLISERDHQERQLELERTESEVLSSTAELGSVRRASQLDLKVKKLAAQDAKRKIENAEEAIRRLSLTAPEDGVAMISSHPWMGTKIASGDTVQPGWTIVRLPDLREMVVRATLSDVDDGAVEIGMDAEVTFDSDPTRVAKGKVTNISAIARETQRQDLLRSFDVEVALEKMEGEWARPGMSARVEVLATQLADELLVPRESISFSQEKPTVFLQGGDAVEVTSLGCNSHRCAVKTDSAVLIAGAVLARAER